MLIDDERRDFKRLAADTDVTVSRLSSGEVLTARLSNLSASGCAFHCEAAVEDGEELEILVRSPSERIEPLRRVGQVTRVSQIDQDRLVAVHFLTQDD